jgi:carboxylate-amine ligase
MAAGVIDELREHAQQLGCEDELVSLTDLIEEGTGARRQLNWFDAHGSDMLGLLREIIAASAP